MKGIYYTCFFLLSVFGMSDIHAQNPNIGQYNSKVLVAEEGTFQIIPKGKILELVTIETRQDIEAMRQEDVDVYWNMSDMSTVYIPSKDKIRQANFSPLSLYAE